MWKPFQSSDNLYLINIEEQDEQFTISVTDLVELWKTEFSLEELMHRFKDKNPLIEATSLIVKNNFIHLTENISKIETKIDCEENTLILNITQSCEGFMKELSQTIVYEFTLQREAQNEFKSKITVPLIQTIHLLEEQQTLLLSVLKNKDRELQEYHMEKGEISRGDLKTEPFKPEKLCTENEKLFLNTFTNSSCSEFWDKFKKEHGEVKAVTLSVDTEPWNQTKKIKKVYNSKTIVKKGSGVTYASKK